MFRVCVTFGSLVTRPIPQPDQRRKMPHSKAEAAAIAADARRRSFQRRQVDGIGAGVSVSTQPVLRRVGKMGGLFLPVSSRPAAVSWGQCVCAPCACELWHLRKDGVYFDVIIIINTQPCTNTENCMILFEKKKN